VAIQGLIILTGAIPGIRDLFWLHDEDPRVIGYVPFRSEDRFSAWVRLTDDPIPGHRFRDATRLDEVIREVVAEEWCDRGGMGYYTFKITGAPIYGELVDGRVILASQPQHVQVWIDDQPVRPVRVDGADGTVWLPKAFGMQETGDRREMPLPEITSTSVVKVQYKKLGNFVSPTPEARSYYAVVPVLQDGTLAHQPGAPGTEVVNTFEVDKPNYIYSRMVEMNAWLFEQPGEPAHLLLRRSRGKRCGCVTSGQARTGCTSCYETGIVGGYYGPYDFDFIDPDTGTTKELNEGGVKVTRQSRSYLGPVPVIQAGDLIIRKNGERLVIATPTYKSPKGILLQQDFDVTLLPAGDTRYRVPLRPALMPEPFNPAFDTPGGDGEPVTSPLTDPTKTWEGDVVPVGRTIVFQNIQT
jgi:hypothetical protein